MPSHWCPFVQPLPARCSPSWPRPPASWHSLEAHIWSRPPLTPCPPTHTLSSAHWHQEKVLTCHWAHQLFVIWPAPLASLPPPPGWHRSWFHFLSSALALLCPRSPRSHDPTPPSSQIPTLASKHVITGGLFLGAIPPAAKCRQAPWGAQHPGSTLATSGSG